MEETTSDLTPNETIGRFVVPVLQSPEANSDIETIFIQGSASYERAVGELGELALIKSKSSHKGAVVNSGEPDKDVRKTKSRKKEKKRKRSPSPSPSFSSDADLSDLDTNITENRKEIQNHPINRINKWHLLEDIAI